jgi:hypothetical protein
MRIAGTISDVQFDADEEMGGRAQEHGTIYEVLVCSKCARETIRAGFYYDGMEEDEWTPSILYPTEPKTLSSLPPLVQQEYEAARAVAPISPNAYAVMLGRVLDAVCQDRGAAGDTLHKRLSDLAAKGEIPKTLADMAQNVRQFRNVGAHADLGSLTKAEIPFLESLSNAILEYLYEAPRLVESAQKRLDALKTK